MSLPLLAGMGATDARFQVESGWSGGRRIVQLLGQAADFRDALQDALGGGYQVVGAPGDAAAGHAAHVLIADVPVTGLQGLAAIADVRAQCAAASLVLLTFYDHHYQETRSFLDRIADAVVLKPVDFDGLAHTVRRLAESSAAPGESRGRPTEGS